MLNHQNKSAVVAAAEYIPGWMNADELGWLYDTARGCRHWLEVGSWHGRSMFATVCGLPDDSVFTSVDANMPESTGYDTDIVSPTPDWVPQHLKLNASLLRQIRPAVYIKIIQAHSTGAVPFVTKAIAPDAIFIDASHDEDSVRNDLQTWYSVLRPGGLLCGHDYHPFHAGVVQAVNSFLMINGVAYPELHGVQALPGSIWAYRKPE